MKAYKNITKNIISSIAILLLTIICCTTIVQAESTTTINVNGSVNMQRRMEVKEKVREIKARASTSTKEERQERSGMRSDRACDAISDRINKRIENFGTVFERHLKIYELHKEKLLQIKLKVEAEGISTTQLSADIEIFDQKIAKLIEDKEKVKSALENTQNYVCGESDGEFRKAMEAVREAQKTVAEDAKDIRDFIAHTLRQDIIDLRASVKANIK